MHDAAKDRDEIIQHLQAALDRCEGVGAPILEFLIERALDEARALDWGRTRTEGGSRPI